MAAITSTQPIGAAGTATIAPGAKKNRGVVYVGPRKLEVREVPYPRLYLDEQKRECPHGVIVKLIATNICGSDLHMYHGRTNMSPGMTFGHEITGEVIELGRDVEVVKLGDIVSVPFNVACGRCDNCKCGFTNACLRVNPDMPGGAYGYVNMGGWQGGQTEYVMVPYADFNCLVINGPRDLIMDKILDIALLSDIFPTGYHGAVTAGVTTGSLVYVAGAGPVGLCAAASSFLLGAGIVIVGDTNDERLALARLNGCHTINIGQIKSLPDEIKRIIHGAGFIYKNEVDCAIECVGFEARGSGGDASKNVPMCPLDHCFEVCKAGGMVGVTGVFVPVDPGGPDKKAKQGVHLMEFATGWNKGLTISTGQCPVAKYNNILLSAIMTGRIQIAKFVNVTVVGLEDAVAAYKEFDNGAAKKFVLDPHGIVRAHLAKGRPAMQSGQISIGAGRM
jgi:glutathione-independent formaldehyde dehydrogenase